MFWKQWICVGIVLGMADAALARISSKTGIGSSGGGVAVVCRSSDGKIERPAVMLDLYEGQVRYGLEPFSASGNVVQDYVQAVKNTFHLQSADDIPVGDETVTNAQNFIKDIKFTAAGTHLQSLHDLGETVAPPSGCALEQLAIFHDATESVDVDSEIWGTMDSANQAALLEHELFYHEDRSLKETTSEGTRASVAHIFAKSGVVPVKDGLPAVVRNCVTGNADTNPTLDDQSSFYLVHAGDATIFQLAEVMHRAIFAKATVTLPMMKMTFKYVPSGNDYSYVVDEPGANVVTRVPVVGSQRRDWELGVSYIDGSPMKISLYEKGVMVRETTLTSCL